MEIRINLLNVLHVVAWVIFIGLCIDAGGCITSAAYTMFINPINAATFWVGNDLSALYQYDPGYFLVETILISIATVLKAILSYLIVKLLYDKKLNMAQPFNDAVRRFLILGSVLAFAIGFFTLWGVKYTKWIVSLGVVMPDSQQLRLGGADVWMLMGVILFVIAQIFKRGMEIQSENELTV